MPTNLKTDQHFLDRLNRAAKHRMTADEIRRQRASFVYGNLPASNTMTKAEVAAALARFDGEQA